LFEQLCFSAGLKPAELYDLTTEQAIRVYKGKVQDWRIQRACANLIHRSLVEKPVNIFEAIPLPFDDDIIEQGEAQAKTEDEEMIRYYNEAKEKGLV
jgi:hypothetical protein